MTENNFFLPRVKASSLRHHDGDAYQFPFVNGCYHFFNGRCHLSNQALSHIEVIIFPGLIYIKANKCFRTVLERTMLEPELNLRQKLWTWVACY